MPANENTAPLPESNSNVPGPGSGSDQPSAAAEMPPPSPPHDSAPGAPAPTAGAPESTGLAADESSPAGQPAASPDEFDEYEPLTPELVEEEAIRGDFVLRWAVVLLALLLGSTRISESATLVRIKTGQYLAGHGILPPANDVFSYTAEDRPWTNLAWGFDLLAAGIHAAGSFAGLSVFKALLIALAFWLIGSISRPGLPTWWGSICGGLALLACHLRLAADPALVTLLGVSLAMWLFFGWRESPASHRRLWLLAPLFLVWSNLDGWAWTGLAFLVLYAAGDSLGAWLGSPVALPGSARKELWKVTGASVLATLVHPFGWKSLAAPWFTYAVEYTALREYISEAYLGLERSPAGVALQFFPMTTPTFWQDLDPAAIASLTVLVAAAVTFVLNWSRLDAGQAAVYLGFVGLAVACLHELPVAAIVACVVATLNGQQWYAAACRQTYSVATGELVFSRGGRALTVLVFAAIAFFGGTGRLRDAAAASARTGFGLDHNLELQLEDMRRQLEGEASFDRRPFNVYLTQGDQLIWIGERVFADSRAAVYYSSNEDDNLLAQHLVTRDALRSQRDRDSQRSSRGPRRSIWGPVLKKYNVTHAVLRLVNVRDYDMLSDFLQDNRYWEWTSLGAAAAVFYQKDTDPPSPELEEYVEAHKIDFRKQAWQSTAEPFAGRPRWIRAPSFYQKYFWSTRLELPAEIHESRHLLVLASAAGLPPSLSQSAPAMVLLAIRRAQAGLAKDPDAVDGYLVLAQAYDLLARIEAGVAASGSRSPRNGMRYLETVAAFNQALVGDPRSLSAHQRLFTIYSEAQKLDLALRHLEALDAILSENPDENADDLEKIGTQLGQFRKKLQAIDDDLAQRAASESNAARLAQGYLQNGCVLRALRELERGGPEVAGNIQVEQLRIMLLLEAGRVEEAYTAAQRFGEVAQQAGVPGWADVVALASLPFADYVSAIERWRSAANIEEGRALNGMLLSMAPHNSNYEWPLSTTVSAFNLFYQQPEASATTKVNVALTYVEEGQNRLAEQYFRDALTANPETVHRPLIAYYIRELTGGKDSIDSFPPSERVFELFAPEPEDDRPQSEKRDK